MEWTQTTPTEPGRYWYKGSHGHPSTLKDVYEYGDHLTSNGSSGRNGRDIAELPGWWYGPVEPPPFPMPAVPKWKRKALRRAARKREQAASLTMEQQAGGALC